MLRTMTDRQLSALEILTAKVEREGQRQVDKWGIQRRTPFEWMTYLTEEVGELAQAVSEAEYRNGDDNDVVREAIQAATLALKIAEMYGGDALSA